MFILFLGFVHSSKAHFPSVKPQVTPSPQPTPSPQLSPSPTASNHFQILQTIPKANVLVLGRSSSGKTSLINALLNSTVLDPKAPPSEVPTKATVSSLNVIFHDSAGFDVGNFDVHLKKLEDQLVEANRSSERESHFDVVLMAISSIGIKWGDSDLKLVSKVVQEWGFPLGIVFTRYIGPLSDYEKDPKQDSSDELIGPALRDLKQKNITNVDFFRVNSVPNKKDNEVIFPVAGLERLSRYLKELVDNGLKVTTVRIKENKLKKQLKKGNQTIEDAVKACGDRCGRFCLSPSTVRKANAEISQKMIEQLLKIFKVEGSNPQAVVDLFNSFQDGLVPQDGRIVKWIHNLELLRDSATGSSQCKRQMRKLGNLVMNWLKILHSKDEAIQIKKVLSVIPHDLYGL
jgi:GTP-binding protein EngB required for normal cell division